MENILEKVKGYDLSSFLSLSECFDAERSLKFVEGYFNLPKKHIYQHDRSKSEQRNYFFIGLLKFFKSKDHQSAYYYLMNKLLICNAAEELYRRISSSLKKCDISKSSVAEQCWAQIIRAQKDISLIAKEIREDRSEKLKLDGGVTLSRRKIKRADGFEYDPDYAIERVIECLTLALKFLAHIFKWEKDGEIVIPSKVDVSDELCFQAGSVQRLAVAWGMLDEVSTRCMLFDGSVFSYSDDEVPEDAKRGGIKTSFHFEPRFSFFEKLDLVSNLRFTELHSQDFFELVFAGGIENCIAPDDYLFLNLYQNIFVSMDEISAISMLNRLFCADFLSDKREYEGLSIREWVRCFSCLRKLSNEFDGSSECEISKDEILATFVHGGISDAKTNVFLGHATFSLKSDDLFDCPLLKMENGNYCFFVSAFKSCSIFHVVYSTLNRLDVVFDKKGTNFEKKTVSMFLDTGLKVKSFKFKRNDSQFEYDAVVIFGRYVFVVECKNRGLSSLNVQRAARVRRLLDDTSQQLKRLIGGLKLYPEVFEEHFGEKLENYEVIPLMINSLPFSYQGKYKGIYITDFSSIGRFFSSRNITLSSKSRDSEKRSQIKAIHALWEGDFPVVDDFLSQLENPIQLEVYLNNIDSVGAWHLADEAVAFTATTLGADLHVGIEKRFGAVADLAKEFDSE